jgi:hypothetical protein
MYREVLVVGSVEALGESGHDTGEGGLSGHVSPLVLAVQSGRGRQQAATLGPGHLCERLLPRGVVVKVQHPYHSAPHPNSDYTVLLTKV